MLKKAIISLSVLNLFIFSSGMVFSMNVEALLKEQDKLSNLKESNLASLIFFSENEPFTDTNITDNEKSKQFFELYNIAQKHYEQSNISVSYHEYKKLVNQAKSNDFYLILLAYKLADSGFFSLAYDCLQKTGDYEIFGKHTEVIRQHYFPNVNLTPSEEIFYAGLLADIIYNNLTEESLIQFAKKESKITDSDYGNYILAKAYLAEKNTKKALSEINNAISKNPDNIQYKKCKAEILTSGNMPKAALKTLNQIPKDCLIFPYLKQSMEKIKYYALSQESKKEIDTKYNLAYYFYLNKDYKRAINELNVLMLKGDVKSAELLCEIYLTTGKTEEAKKICQKYINKNKKYAFANKGLGDIFMYEKKYADAIIYYKFAEKYNKKDINTLISLCVAYDKIDAHKLALTYLNKAKKTDKNDFRVLYLESKLTQDNGKQNLKNSICQNPFYPEGWIDLAENALSLKDIYSAEDYINIAAYVSKNNPRYFYYKSLINTKKKDYDSAEADLTQSWNILQRQNNDSEQANKL